MRDLWTILVIFIQPVLWLGVIRTYLNYRKRIKQERKNYNTSIYSNNFEMKHFWTSLVVFGIIGSILTSLMGIYLAIPWIVIYEILIFINLLIIPGQFMAVLDFAVATGLTFLVDQMGWLSQFDLSDSQQVIPSYQNVLALLTVIVLLLGFYIKHYFGKHNFPRIFTNQRGTKVAGYLNKEFSIIPLLVLIPGNQIHEVIKFWPVFSVGTHSFSLMILPVLFGIRMTVFKTMPNDLFHKLGNKIIWVAVLGIILTAVSYWFPEISIYAILVLTILYLAVVLRVKMQDHNSDNWFDQAVNGLRVIAIRPQTPADKMGIKIGDLIVEVNNEAVHSEGEFYKALLDSPTFCRLKVINRNGRIKIVETAIYSDAPTEMGVEVFEVE